MNEGGKKTLTEGFVGLLSEGRVVGDDLVYLVVGDT